MDRFFRPPQYWPDRMTGTDAILLPKPLFLIVIELYFISTLRYARPCVPLVLCSDRHPCYTRSIIPSFHNNLCTPQISAKRVTLLVNFRDGHINSFYIK